MSRFPTLLVALSASLSGCAQGWWAQGACWIYKQLWLQQSLEVYTYLGDTVIDGWVAQECAHRTCYLYWGNDTSCVSDIWQIRDYVSQQGDVVYYKNNFLPNEPWDTLYYLGNPGDYWYPLHADMSCAPLGKIIIEDTGHVVVDGMNLRVWDLVQLDENGFPLPEGQMPGEDSLKVYERIGGTPRRFTGYVCDTMTVVEYGQFDLLHYSDWEITTGGGPACDIVLNTNDHASPSSINAFPNPGSDQVHFLGLPPGISNIDIRDALGRRLMSTLRISKMQSIDVSQLADGSYFIEITSPASTRQVLRWVKE